MWPQATSYNLAGHGSEAQDLKLSGHLYIYN